jgi:lysophospholipase L1-like esterase
VTGKGYFPWAQNLLGWPWRLLNIGATTGDKIAEAVARLQSDVLAYFPDDCLVLIGINDAHAWTAAAEADTAFATLIGDIVEPLMGNGTRPLLCTLTPSDDLNTAAKQAGWYRYNQLIREYCARTSQVRLIELAAGTYSDLATGYGADGAYMDDNVHPNTRGAALIGEAIARALPELVQPRRLLGVVTGDGNNGATSAGWVFDTGAAAGTKAGTPLPTGNVPTSWTLTGTCTNATGTTIAASMVASSDGGSDWQQIVLSGAGMSGQTNCQFQLSGTNLTLAGSNFAVGDWVELRMEVEVDAGHVGLIGFEPSLSFVSATANQYYTPRSLNTAGFVAVDDLSGSRMVGSYMVQIPSGTTAIKVICAVKFETALAAASATVRMRDPVIRKVTPPATFAPDYVP